MISFDIIWIPIILTISMIIIMFRPYEQENIFDFGSIFRLFWVIPILSIWIIYLIVK
jgi:hypothetical protein